MAKESWYLNESEADDYQIQVIQKNLKSSFIVKGCAGSGKTLLAIWKAAELAESGEKDYLVIVFTKALKQFINDGIREVGLDESKVMYHWEWKYDGSPKADYIIVDEVQDFDENELSDLQQSAKKHLILFGDSAQQLYKNLPNKGRLLSMEEIQVKTKIPMENLVINHRLPKKVARVAQIISSSRDELEARCKKEGVNKPRLIQCASYDHQLDYIKDVVEANSYTDVGILFPSNDDVKRAYDYYNNKGWDTEKKSGYGLGSMNLDFSTDNPKIMTYHSAKGLQFEVVFLPNFVFNEDSNPIYVAITRTYRDLFILHSDIVSPFNGMVDNSYFNVIDATDYEGAEYSSGRSIQSNVDLNENFDDIDDDLPF